VRRAAVCELQAVDLDGRPIGDFLGVDSSFFDEGMMGGSPPAAMARDGRLAWVQGEGLSSVLIVDGEQVGPLPRPAPLAWSPDSRWLFTLDRGESGRALVAIDTTTSSSEVRITLQRAAGYPRSILAFRTPD
jgi:hypothetical protein